MAFYEALFMTYGELAPVVFIYWAYKKVRNKRLNRRRNYHTERR